MVEEVGQQAGRKQVIILGFRTNYLPPTLGKEVRCSEGQSLPLGEGGSRSLAELELRDRSGGSE